MTRMENRLANIRMSYMVFSKLNAGYAVAVCAVFAMLIQGGQYIQIALGVPSAVSDIVQGLILFFVLGSEFFMRYRVHIGRNSKEVA